VPGGVQGLDRYAYVNNNPTNYVDPTGNFTEKEIISYYGVSTWDEVLALFYEGGLYEGRWGWLEVLRKAENGDKLYVDWGKNEGQNNGNLQNGNYTFNTDENGNLTLEGENHTVDASLAGLLGENYSLTHYHDITGKGGTPPTKFSTTALHDPYIHTKINWEEVNILSIDHLLYLSGSTFIFGSLTVGFTASFMTGGPLTMAVSMAGAPVCAFLTYHLGNSTIIYFENEFLIYTP